MPMSETQLPPLHSSRSNKGEPMSRSQSSFDRADTHARVLSELDKFLNSEYETFHKGLTPLSSVGSTPLSGSPRKGSAGQKLTPLPYNRNSDLFLQSAGSSFRSSIDTPFWVAPDGPSSPGGSVQLSPSPPRSLSPLAMSKTADFQGSIFMSPKTTWATSARLPGSAGPTSPKGGSDRPPSFKRERDQRSVTSPGGRVAIAPHVLSTGYLRFAPKNRAQPSGSRRSRRRQLPLNVVFRTAVCLEQAEPAAAPGGTAWRGLAILNTVMADLGVSPVFLHVHAADALISVSGVGGIRHLRQASSPKAVRPAGPGTNWVATLLEMDPRPQLQALRQAQHGCDWVAALHDLQPLPMLALLQRAAGGAAPADWVGALAEMCPGAGLQALLLAVRPAVDWVGVLRGMSPTAPGIRLLEAAQGPGAGAEPTQSAAGDWVGVLTAMHPAPGLQALLLAVRPAADWVAALHAMAPAPGLALLRAAQGGGAGASAAPTAAEAWDVLFAAAEGAGCAAAPGLALLRDAAGCGPARAAPARFVGLALLSGLGLEPHAHLRTLLHATLAVQPGSVTALPGLALLEQSGPLGPSLHKLMFAAVSAGAAPAARAAAPAPASASVPAKPNAACAPAVNRGVPHAQLPGLTLLAHLQEASCPSLDTLVHCAIRHDQGAVTPLPGLAALAELGLADRPALTALVRSSLGLSPPPHGAGAAAKGAPGFALLIRLPAASTHSVPSLMKLCRVAQA